MGLKLPQEQLKATYVGRAKASSDLATKIRNQSPLEKKVCEGLYDRHDQAQSSKRTQRKIKKHSEKNQKALDQRKLFEPDQSDTMMQMDSI